MSTELLDAGIPKKSKPREDLDNVNGILAMGIVSIVLSLVLIGGILSFGPLLLGILAIMKGRQATSLYKDYPNDYTDSSYRKGQAGYVCGIIGTCIWGVSKLLILMVLSI